MLAALPAAAFFFLFSCLFFKVYCVSGVDAGQECRRCVAVPHIVGSSHLISVHGLRVGMAYAKMRMRRPRQTVQRAMCFLTLFTFAAFFTV